ncbi:unnamed protein product [Hymenolepis diminuta]|nr:unnamed protein product [Hymenolepis diminuta]
MADERLMERVTVLFLFSMFVAASTYEDEHLVERFERPLGEIMKLEDEALKSDAAKVRVESALKKLAEQNGGCRRYKLVNISSGTRQVVDGFNFEFVVEVESVPTEKCATEQPEGISEVYKITIYEPSGTGREKRHTFEKIMHGQS